MVASSCEENSSWRKACAFSCNCSTRLAPISAEQIAGFRNTQAKAICANDCCRAWATAWRRCKTATTSGVTRDAFNVPCGWAALDADGMPCRYLSLVAEHALAERRESDATYAFRFQRAQHSLFQVAAQQVVRGLVDQAGRAQVPQDRHRRARTVRIVIRQAGVQGFAAADGGIQRAHGLFQRRFEIHAVAVKDIRVFEAQAFQALIQAGQEIFAGTAVAVGTGPHAVSRLGRDNEFVAVALEILIAECARKPLPRIRAGGRSCSPSRNG